MKDLRRFLSIAVIVSTVLALLAVRDIAQPRGQKEYRGYIGNYTSKTSSKGIYEFRFDAATGKMSALELAGETQDPSWVVVHPNGKYLYAANEMGKPSTVSAFAINPASGKLTLLNELPALGEDPCHLSFDRSGRFLFVANYTSGTVAVFPIRADGSLGEHTAALEDKGATGPNKKRQDRSHAHWIAPSEHNRFVYVADLGLDRVLVYAFDASKGTLAPLTEAAGAELKPGTGPRHIAFSQDGKFMYSIDANTGKLTQVADISTGGKEPRHFAIDPTGNFLLAENQLSDSIVEFRIDLTTGKLTPTGETLSAPSPICIAFARAE